MVIGDGLDRGEIAVRRRVADDVDRVGPVTRSVAKRRSAVQRRVGELSKLTERSSSSSTSSTPAPPPLVTTATRARSSGPNIAVVSAASNSSSSPLTRSMPARCNAASTTRSAPDESAGMGRGRFGGGRMAPSLHGDDRLDACGSARGGHELARIWYRFEIKQDRVGLRVACKQVEVVAYVDVCHIAQRDDLREPNVVVGCPVDQRGDDGARLRHQGDIAWLGCHVGEPGVEPSGGIIRPRVFGPMMRKRLGLAASSICWRKPFSRVIPAVMTTAARVPFSDRSRMIAWRPCSAGVTITPRSGTPGSSRGIAVSKGGPPPQSIAD